MEAVRSDFTPMARAFQARLIALAFSGAGEDALREFSARRRRPCGAAKGIPSSCTARTSGAWPTITPPRRPR